MSGSGAERDETEEDPWFRPVWADNEDETDAPAIEPDLGQAALTGVARSAFARGVSAGLLRALSDAEDALSRLDAAALAAPDPVREGLAARLAFREAAGWLAHTGHWVHPLDLALRDLGLTGSYAAAALSRQSRRALPATLAETRTTTPPEDITEVAGDRDVALALALARALRRLATAQTWRPLKDADAVLASLLVPLGGGMERSQLPAWTAWREALRAERERLPPLLVALAGADRWLALEVRLGGTGADAELRAGALAAAVLAQERRSRAVPLPLWAAVPLRTGLRRQEPMPLGCSEESAIAFLTLLAEAARDGSRELERLHGAARRGAAVVTGCDRRSRLPQAVEAALRTPALTPKALARLLHVVPQTATALLRDLAQAGVVREATGRKSFRAFAA